MLIHLAHRDPKEGALSKDQGEKGHALPHFGDSLGPTTVEFIQERQSGLHHLNMELTLRHSISIYYICRSSAPSSSSAIRAASGIHVDRIQKLLCIFGQSCMHGP